MISILKAWKKRQLRAEFLQQVVDRGEKLELPGFSAVAIGGGVGPEYKNPGTYFWMYGTACGQEKNAFEAIATKNQMKTRLVDYAVGKTLG